MLRATNRVLLVISALVTTKSAMQKPYIINTMTMVDYAYDFCFEGVGGKAWIKRPDNYNKSNFSANRMFTVGRSTVVKGSSSIQPQIYFKNLILDGNRSGQKEFNVTFSMQHHHAINVEDATNTRKRAKLTCIDVDFRNTGGDGVGIYMRSEVTLIRPTFHNCFRGGVCVVGNDNIIKITDAVSTDDLETHDGVIQGYISGYYEEIEDGVADISCINQVDIDGWDLYQGWFHCDMHARTLPPVDITKLKTHSFKNVRVHPNNEAPDVVLPPLCVVDNCEFNTPTTYINIDGSVITGTKICQHVTDYRKATLIAAGTTTLNAVRLMYLRNYNNQSPVNRMMARSAIRDTTITLDQTALNSGFSLCGYQHPYQAVDGGFYVNLHDRDVMLLDNVNILPYYPDWDASGTSIGFFDTGCQLDGANCTIRNSTIIAKTCLYIDNAGDSALAYVKLKDNTYYFTQYRSVLGASFGAAYIEESGVIEWCDDVKLLLSTFAGIINYGSRKLIVYSDPTSSVGSISNFSIGKVIQYLSTVKKKYIKLPVLNVTPGTLSIVVNDYQIRDTITDDGVGNINSTLGVTGTIDYNLGIITLTDTGSGQTHTGDLFLTCQWTNNVIGHQGDIAILYNNPSTKWKQTSVPTRNSTTATWISVP